MVIVKNAPQKEVVVLKNGLGLSYDEISPLER